MQARRNVNSSSVDRLLKIVPVSGTAKEIICNTGWLASVLGEVILNYISCETKFFGVLTFSFRFFLVIFQSQIDSENVFR